MQLVDSKLSIANAQAFGSDRQRVAVGEAGSSVGDANGRTERSNFFSRRNGTSAAKRLLVLLLAAFVVTVSPALLETVRSTVSLSLQVLLQASHAGLIAFQILGR